MRFLIDTHILIWFLEGKAALSTPRKSLIIDGDNSVLRSVASLWEMAIKLSLGKLSLAVNIPEIIDKIDSESIKILAITQNHILRVSNLPFHHRDPFDRMIIAQALIENIPLMSVDDDFAKYGVTLL